MPEPILNVDHLDLNPLIRRLPGQKENKSDESWQRFKQRLSEYVHDGVAPERITNLTNLVTSSFAVWVDGSGVSEADQEATNKEFASEIARMNNNSFECVLRAVEIDKDELSELYSSLFDEGYQYPEFDYKVAKTLDMFPNKPTKEDLDTIPSIFDTTIKDINAMRLLNKEQKDILCLEAMKLREFSSRFHTLNNVDSCDSSQV